MVVLPVISWYVCRLAYPMISVKIYWLPYGSPNNNKYFNEIHTQGFAQSGQARGFSLTWQKS
jgi:hypothetical protein